MKLSLAIISSLVMLSCAEDEKPVTDKSQETKKDTIDVKKASGKNDRMYYWLFETKGEDADSTPFVKVSLIYDGHLYYVNTAMLNFAEIDSAEFSEMNIPAGSVAAARGKWKSLCEDYWINRSGNCMHVYKRTRKENDEHGKTVKIREIYLDRDYK